MARAKKSVVVVVPPPVVVPVVPSSVGTRVFVLSSAGWVQHGPTRRSPAQASSVARLLRKRLGWVTCAADVPPTEVPASDLAPALASLSPVWKDATLAKVWAAAGK